MAKIIYEVYQNQNEHSRAFGKYYARVKYLESLNTRRLSNHIAEHGSIYTPDVVYGVMEKFRSCLLEMLLESKRVKIEGLGTFYATIECSKGGAVSKDKFNVQKNIEGLHIRFLPEQEQETNISSRQFLKQAEFVNVEALQAKLKDDEEGDDSGSQTGGNGGGSTGGNTNPDAGDGPTNDDSGDGPTNEP
jgi:predicted histone-like DNA-binding protein